MIKESFNKDDYLAEQEALDAARSGAWADYMEGVEHADARTIETIPEVASTDRANDFELELREYREQLLNSGAPSGIVSNVIARERKAFYEPESHNKVA